MVQLTQLDLFIDRACGDVELLSDFLMVGTSLYQSQLRLLQKYREAR
jgi:hypothetical protein